MKSLHTRCALRESHLGTSNKLGIFASSLLVAASAACVFSPTGDSHAASSATTKVSVNIGEVIALTLSTDDLALNVSAPTPSGVFVQDSVTASVTTNSLGGYELYLSSVDNDTDMIHEDSHINDVISSNFSGMVNSSSMASNTWGYSIDGTNFKKIPFAKAPHTVRNINQVPTTAEKQTEVHIGAKVSTDIASGSYSKTVVFTAVAHPSPIDTMQNFDKSTLVNTGDQVALRDTRDGSIYTVKKLADGNVWMTDNLRLIGTTITNQDSNITAASFVVPGNNWGDSLDQTDKRTNPYVLDSGSGKFGVYYNFAAASAGTITGAQNNTDATEDICPKGWRLPTGSEVTGLLTAYDVTADAAGVAIMTSAPLNFQLSGSIMWRNANAPGLQGDGGYYWTSTAEDGQYRKDIVIEDYPDGSSTFVGQGHYSRQSGIPMRCIAK